MATLTSQLYILGEAQNASDGILMGIRDVKARNSVVVPFAPVEGSAVGAVAARFDIVLGGTPAQVPVLEITNTTDPRRNPSFRAGDNWRIDIRHATPSLNVYLHLWKDNIDFGISGPYGGVTDSTGAWTMSGSYGATETGSWQAQGVIGTATSQETTAPITIQIYNT
jgi:hypothetical protein